MGIGDRARVAVCVSLVAAIGFAAAAQAQPCQPEWAGGFVMGDLDSSASAAVVFDDGSGPALYVAGVFRHAGGTPVGAIARWDGAAWSPVGQGVDGWINDLAVHDDGSGPALYAGGSFASAGGVSARNIARWNGTAWSAVGPGAGGPEQAEIRGLLSADLGSGPRLYSAGGFQSTSGWHVSVWDGAAWSASGPGFNAGAGATALAVFDGGGGPALYAAGFGLQRLGPSGWSVVPGAPGGNTGALAVYDDGSGPALYIGGNFTTVSGIASKSIARWDGAAWSSVGGGVNLGTFAATVTALRAIDLGSGPELYVGGTFIDAGGLAAMGAATWSADGWASLAAGVSGNANDFVRSDLGGPPAVLAVGNIRLAGGLTVGNIARWDGGDWSPLSPPGNGVDPIVQALASFDDGSGPAVYAGGRFVAAGSAAGRGIARWNGSEWSSVGGGLASGEVLAMAAHDDGSGPGLLVGGRFGLAEYEGEVNLARWRDSAWEPMIPDAAGTIRAVASGMMGGQPTLYIGGDFTMVAGLVANRVARRSGGVWSTLGTGVSGRVNAVLEADLGSGPAVYVGGEFMTAGGNPARYVAKWDGQAWAALGAGPAASVAALAVFNDGSGPALYAAMDSQGVSRWDGASWTTLPGLVGRVSALAVFDDGSGPALYAAGAFSSGGLSRIARWNGAAWTSPGAGISGNQGSVNPSISALLSVVGPGRPMLFAGGSFLIAGGGPSANIAAWTGCPACYANCDGSTTQPILNVNDFICFQTKYAAGDPAANCDGSTAEPTLNVNDFICFQSAYAAGCP